MTVLFPDTNFFFEFRKASDLPWHELNGSEAGKGPDIRLIVPPTVISEIERHKAKGNSRTAKRARDASAMLRQALMSTEHSTVLRPANPKVVLQLPPVVKVDFSELPNLDPARPDHRIAAEFTEIRKVEPELTVFSDDTLAILAVRSLGFEPLLIPENWRLSPEKDERDDEIDRIRTELATYKQSSPTMSVIVKDHNGQSAGIIAATIEMLSINDSDIEKAVHFFESVSPMEHNFKSTPASGRMLFDFAEVWREPKPEEIEKYKTTDYPAWLNSLRNEIPRVIAQINAIARETPFTICLANDGFVNATDVRLTISAFDGITLLDSLGEKQASTRDDRIRLPAPPSPPRGRYISLDSVYGFAKTPDFSAELRNITRPLMPSARDPNGFYYVGGRPDIESKELVLTCDAFPHQNDPHNLGFRILVPDQGDLGRQPRLRIRVHASNLRRPVEEYVSVRVTFEQGDTLGKLESLKYR